MFQKYLKSHFSRSTIGRKMVAFNNSTVALATDLGLKRRENQDRVAALSFRSKNSKYYLIAVADGMGGMKDGEESAVIALSSFFSAALENVELGPEYFLKDAVVFANETVYALTKSRGGSTLSALLINSDGMDMTVNVGDSRIYAKKSDSHEVVRLSVDDSLAEAFGSHGRDLLQFIGMGEGIKPHISFLDDNYLHAYLMTDGIHFIEPNTLSDIVAEADNAIQVVERLIAVSRWCGGPDNASICAIDLDAFDFQECSSDSTVATLFDPFGVSNFIFEQSVNVDSESSHGSDVSTEVIEKRARQPFKKDKSQDVKPSPDDKVSDKTSVVSKSKVTRTYRKPRKRKNTEEEQQLKIISLDDEDTES